MALIVNIETATNICSVCLARDGKVIALRESSEEKSHASLISVLIQEILENQNINIRQLDAIAVSKGPGSYTGLRIGVSVAKGICYGASLPLIGISTLESLSYGILENPELYNIDVTNGDVWLCPMIDARRMEVYNAFYDQAYHEMLPKSATVITRDSYLDILAKHKIIFFGNGSNKCKNVIQHPHAQFLDNIHASASKMVYFAEKAFRNKQFEDVAYFEPFYLKDFQTTLPKKKIL